MCQALTCNSEQYDLVLGLPSGAEMGPPSRMRAGQQWGRHRAGVVREGFLEVVIPEPSPQEKQDLAGGKR